MEKLPGENAISTAEELRYKKERRGASLLRIVAETLQKTQNPELKQGVVRESYLSLLKDLIGSENIISGNQDHLQPELYAAEKLAKMTNRNPLLAQVEIYLEAQRMSLILQEDPSGFSLVDDEIKFWEQKSEEKRQRRNRA